MSHTNYYHELIDQKNITDRTWTDKEWNAYRCAKLQNTNSIANGIYLNACCIVLVGIAICFFLSSIAAVFIKMKPR